MPRIAGIDLPKEKRGVIALTYIFGIGHTKANQIMDKAGIDKDIRAKDWDEDQQAQIRSIIDNDYQVEGAKRSEMQLNIKRLMDIGCYRGVRHRKGLPLRGQQTQTNSRTRKGKRKTVAGKKKAVK